MKKRWILLVGGLCALLLLAVACDEGINDWSSSARVSGWVFTDPSHSHGVEGVQIIIEADPDADVPYEGPDRWTVTDGSGHFEGAVFLGNHSGDYVYVGDLIVGYFWHGKTFSWNGGITVSPGSMFTLPPVDTTMFVPLVSGQ
jgi:hypothetical protein